MRSLAGQLLVASPRLPDENFSRSVVLIIHHDEHGALGVVLNRPADSTVREVWESLSDDPCDSDEPVHIGGPVSGPLMALHTNEECAESEVLPGVFFATHRDRLNRIVQEPEFLFRIYNGYSGWASGQLESELKFGGWMLLPKPNRHFEWGTTTSPVVDEDRVYFIPYDIFEKDVWEMRCPIVCLNMDGTELWRANETFWGTEASTPLVVGDTLYVGADNPQQVVLVALDKRTGALRWATANTSDKQRELGAPASLTYHVIDGIPQVIVATYGTRELLGVHAESGEVMWRYPYPAGIIIGLVSTPVAVDSRLFVCGGEGKDRNFSACLQMEVKDGKISCRELYRSTELQTNMYNTVAIDDDAVFGFGGNKRIGFLHCTNLDDGRLLWRQDSEDWTSEQNLVVADGLIFALTKKNELVMAEAGREGYRELGRVALGIELGRPQQPTIANGRMYIRGDTTVICFKVVP